MADIKRAKELTTRGMAMKISGVTYTAREIQDFVDERNELIEEKASIEKNLTWLFKAKEEM